MKKILIAIGVIILILITGAVFIVHNRRAKVQSLQPVFNVPSQTTDSTTPAASYTAGNYSESIVTADGRTRTYILHIPTGYSASKSYPLVLVLHGGMGTGAKIAQSTNFSAKADAEDFIVVYPDGVESGWNDGRGTSEAEELGVDDVQFIRTLVSSVGKKLPIDTRRVYAAGASNGGMMTYRLGCEASDMFAAIGPDIANMPVPLAATCRPSAIAVVAINGLADPLIPYNGGNCCGKKGGLLGGEGGEVLSTVETLKIFASANGCASTYATVAVPVLTSDGTSVEKRTYNNCPSGKEIISYVVAGMGHNWPPMPAQAPRISGPTSQNINATDVFWDFFEAHPKR